MAESGNNSIGYGPSNRWNRLYFDGDADKYEQWEIKFLGYMKLKKLKAVITSTADTIDPGQNEECFAELIQMIDDRSLSLIMRDAIDDGRKALKILRDHYAGDGKPRVIALYTELTSLRKTADVTVTDYILKAERITCALINAGETISDSLVIAMLIKGLPSDYTAFVAVVTNSEDTHKVFSKFKVALKNFEETEKGRNEKETVMKFKDGRYNKSSRGGGNKSRGGKQYNGSGKSETTCFSCGDHNHKSFKCEKRKSGKLWCTHCESKTHNNKACKKINDDTANAVSGVKKDSEHSFSFTVKDEDVNNHDNVNSTEVFSCRSLLVDSGASCHILHSDNEFVELNNDFKPEEHYIELADGSKENNLVTKKGSARVKFTNDMGTPCDALLNDALCIPSFPQEIFSVQAATKAGAQVNFGPDDAELVTRDGVKFRIHKRGKLYFLDKCNVVKTTRSCDVNTWHKIMGHCNVADLIKMENVVDGMEIKGRKVIGCCENCILGKTTIPISRKPDERSSKPLEFVHVDLCGPIDPVARDGFRYIIAFVDDFSNATFVWMVIIYLITALVINVLQSLEVTMEVNSFRMSFKKF